MHLALLGNEYELLRDLLQGLCRDDWREQTI